MFRITHGLSLILLIMSAEAECMAGEPLVDALAAHKSAVDAIDTIYLRFETNTELNDQNLVGIAPPGKIVGEYWRSRDFERISYTGTDGKEWVYRTPQTVTVVQDSIDPKSRSSISTASIVASGGPVFLAVVPWRDALFALDSQRGRGTQSLAEHIKAFYGRTTYKVSGGQGVLTSENGAVIVKLDPVHNYLIRSKLSLMEGVKKPLKGPGTKEISEEVLDYLEASPGIYFPRQVRIEEKFGGELEYRKTVTFSAVKVNGPMAPDVFTPQYKDGTLVRDFIRSTEYRVNAAGVRQGSETAASIVAVAPPPDPERPRSTLPTSEEERRWGWWLAPLGGILALGGCIILFWRRRQKSN